MSEDLDGKVLFMRIPRDAKPQPGLLGPLEAIDWLKKQKYEFTIEPDAEGGRGIYLLVKDQEKIRKEFAADAYKLERAAMDKRLNRPHLWL